MTYFARKERQTAYKTPGTTLPTPSFTHPLSFNPFKTSSLLSSPKLTPKSTFIYVKISKSIVTFLTFKGPKKNLDPSYIAGLGIGRLGNQVMMINESFYPTIFRKCSKYFSDVCICNTFCFTQASWF